MLDKLNKTEREYLIYYSSFRLILLALIRTSFVPDEYYQVMEPAHNIVYGYSIRTWEWNEDFRLRTYVSLLPFISIYRLAKALNIDNNMVFIFLPRFVQCFISFIGDYHFLQILRKLNLSEFELKVTNLLHCCSWFYSYCTNRTLANSLETVFLLAGTNLFVTGFLSNAKLSKEKIKEDILALFIVCLSTYCRPTIVLFWIPMLLLKFYQAKSKLTYILFQCLPVGFLTLFAAVMVDSLFYGQVTISPFNFYWFNLHHQFAALFGVQAWYWNFLHGLPVVLGFFTPLVFIGIFFPQIPFKIRVLSYLSVGYAIGLHILSPHQEYRFLLPCLPFFHILVGQVFCLGFEHIDGFCRPGFSNSFGLKLKLIHFWYFLMGLIVFCNFGITFYLLRFHQYGTESAFLYLGSTINQIGTNDNASIDLILAAPCYSFPGYSFLPKHSNSSHVWRLFMPFCEPGKATVFDEEPLLELEVLFNRQLSSSIEEDIVDKNPRIVYLLTFDSYSSYFNPYLEARNFSLVSEFPHALFTYDLDDPNPKKTVLLYKKENN